jgi:hypothetical protein
MRFYQGTPVYSTNKTDRHDITEILLKVALNIINQTKTSKYNKQQCQSSLLNVLNNCSKKQSQQL